MNRWLPLKVFKRRKVYFLGLGALGASENTISMGRLSNISLKGANQDRATSKVFFAQFIFFYFFQFFDMKNLAYFSSL